MKKKKSHTKFEEAVGFVNSFTEPIPADVLLKLYAYYKIANDNFDNPGSKTPLINAFKANALFQAKNMNKKQAMKSYIELVAKELK
ncbi:acyl-CoA-binding protein [Maribacter arcticus]|jgi:diazepam-binding inhibitor (GABA receptor modulating acyl-CoA-binding protein)|uniref:Acyl-CoA-binding protein n=1 Tax=Maribacter arcticus TaxID=561365 RepID=A0A1T5ERV2_9FLAO|nr:acyl-CoA-binding protein [Maribacter arcticus]MDA9089756.1 acyl-CoA-binding protein [Maribacter arcticus]SKB86713.1 Acyl-CoA-binding protein [Maribacter arcticus]|tara:strand:- start:423 stop:680 length:258 start_codon:yes stop_codon:yes gene_type:complete